MIDTEEVEKFDMEEEVAEEAGPRFSTRMEYEGLVCPDKWVMDFTPLEFEEVSTSRPFPGSKLRPMAGTIAGRRESATCSYVLIRLRPLG